MGRSESVREREDLAILKEAKVAGYWVSQNQSDFSLE